MKTKTKTVGNRLALAVETAADLMTPNPVSIHKKATLREAAAMLTDREISAAPVIDDAGRPVGVLSRADIVRHDRETATYLKPASEFYQEAELTLPSGEAFRDGFQVQAIDRTEVGEIMTPTVISVPPREPAEDVVAQMLAFKVHRLFVVDDAGVLVGVISAFDILRQLRREEAIP